MSRAKILKEGIMAIIKDTNYFVIHGWMLNVLHLSGNELMAYAIIYGFSQDETSEFSGSRSYLSKFMNVSLRTVDNVLASLQEKGLITKRTSVIGGVAVNSYTTCVNCIGGANFTGGSENFAHNKEVYIEYKENLTKETDTKFTASLTAHNEQPSSRPVANKDNGNSEYDKITKYFEQTWSIYPRKESKVQAKTTFTHKVYTKDEEISRANALRIYKILQRQNVAWGNENNGNGREKQYIPLFSSWLNDNFEDVPKKERGKTK